MLSRLPLSNAKNSSQSFWFWIILAVITVLLIIQIVRFILLLVSPATPVGGWQPRQAVIASPEEREAILSRYNPFSGETLATTPQGDGPTRITALDLVLYGTRMNAVTGRGSAIIAGNDGVQQNFLIGDEVIPGVKLVAVAFDNVTLERGGARESLFIDQSDDVTPVSPEPPQAVANLAGAGAGQPEVAKPDGNDNAALLATGVGFLPRQDGSKVTGLSVKAQGDGAVFKRLGFREGDVIVAYDGNKITSAKDTSALIAKARPGSRFSVLVERGANIVPIAIIIPEN
ncbi:type II secretion system protein N [Parasphingorhabdus sp. DH2-15]|uniref:type II secretion system protein N n=1 Tax=Parasphingorhabdus sp. DH2-15 TaxID=3444112 RepID=UPI003F686F9D